MRIKNYSNKFWVQAIFLLALQVLFFACSPTRLVKPLAKGEQAIGANLGGPLIQFAGAPIPIPYTSAFYAKGLNNKTSVFGSVHLTALAFGVFQTDIGICQQVYHSSKMDWGIGVNPALNIAIDRWEWNTKIWPQLDINVYKNWGTKRMLYLGVNNWFEPSAKRAHNETQAKHWYLNPHIGFMYNRGKYSYGVETKWVAPGVTNVPNVVDYIGVNQQGALGVYFQFLRKF
jgi:hypothetical protein